MQVCVHVCVWLVSFISELVWYVFPSLQTAASLHKAFPTNGPYYCWRIMSILMQVGGMGVGGEGREGGEGRDWRGGRRRGLGGRGKGDRRAEERGEQMEGRLERVKNL